MNFPRRLIIAVIFGSLFLPPERLIPQQPTKTRKTHMTTLLATSMTPALKWLIGLVCLSLIIGGLTGCFSTRKDIKPARPHLVFDSGTKTWNTGFVAANGTEVWASNRAFADKGEAIAHYSEVRRRMVNSAVPDMIVRMKDERMRYRWKLFAAGGTLETSDQSFATSNAAKENYRDLREAVLNCPPQDLDIIPQPL
jgi:hypothetical protein